MTSLALELQPICWEDIECALVEWAAQKLDLDEAQVIWANVDLPQPPYPYITLFRVSGPTREGGTDELRTSTDLSQPAGQEIELLTTGPREFTVSISAFVDALNGGHEAARNAVTLLAKLEASLDQLSVRSRLNEAGLSLIETLAINDTSVIVNSETQSRATFDVRFRTASVMTERTGYIDKVQIESTELNVDTIIDAS